MNEFLFVEKYAPNSVEDCILPVHIKNTLIGFRDSGEIPNLILSGVAGVGKTSSIKALADDLQLDLLFINGSNEGRLLDTVRDKVIQFCSTVSMMGDTNRKKLVLIDEFDNTLDTVQLALRGVIEEFQSNVSFVFTVNNYSKVLPAIVSRCSTIHYSIPKSEYKALSIQTYNRLSWILTNEEKTFDRTVLIQIIKKLFPDIRRVFNEVQRYSANGHLDSSSLSFIGEDKIQDLIKAMKHKRFEEMRVWVSEHSEQSPQYLFRLLYDALRGALDDAGIAQSILTIADYQYKANFVVDPEINFLACIVEIVYSEIKFK